STADSSSPLRGAATHLPATGPVNRRRSSNPSIRNEALPILETTTPQERQGHTHAAYRRTHPRIPHAPRPHPRRPRRKSGHAPQHHQKTRAGRHRAHGHPPPHRPCPQHNHRQPHLQPTPTAGTRRRRQTRPARPAPHHLPTHHRGRRPAVRRHRTPRPARPQRRPHPSRRRLPRRPVHRPRGNPARADPQRSHCRSPPHPHPT